MFGAQLETVLMITSAASAALVFWLHRNQWRITLKLCLGVTAYLAFACLICASEIRDLFSIPIAYWRNLQTAFIPFLLWPFLVAWIVLSANFTAPVRRFARSTSRASFPTRTWPNSTCWQPPFWFLVVLVYLALHKIWTLSVWPMAMLPMNAVSSAGTIWSVSNNAGFSLRAIDHAVNFAMAAYVGVNLWREWAERGNTSRLRLTPFAIALALLLAKHLAIPPF